MIYDDKGCVIRCVELMDTGRVYYRGMKDAYHISFSPFNRPTSTTSEAL